MAKGTEKLYQTDGDLQENKKIYHDAPIRKYFNSPIKGRTYTQPKKGVLV